MEKDPTPLLMVTGFSFVEPLVSSDIFGGLMRMKYCGLKPN